jgi:hypothetical protein
MDKSSNNTCETETSSSSSSVFPSAISDITARDIAGMIVGLVLAYLMFGI